MIGMIEALESRSLFSAGLSTTLTTDLAAVTTDVSNIRSLYTQYTPEARSDLKALVTSIRQAGGAGTAAVVSAVSNRYYAIAEADLNAVLIVGSASLRLVAADAIQAAAHPTSRAWQARLTADVTRSNNRASALVNTLEIQANRLGNAAGAALAAVANKYAGNTAVTDALDTFEAHGQVFTNTIGGEVQTLGTDFGQFMTDAAAGN
jgi:hypothetical protein